MHLDHLNEVLPRTGELSGAAIPMQVASINVGILFILVGRSTAKKLASARRSAVTPEQLQEKFAIADLDGKGALSKEQFGRLITEDLGLDLTRREVESAFLQMDCESRGRVNYESVLRWWKDDADKGDYEIV